MPTRPKILLIEDDQSALSALQRVLTDEDYAVEMADRGDMGLQQAKLGKFDVVISDFKLPGVNGLELVKRIAHVQSTSAYHSHDRPWHD